MENIDEYIEWVDAIISTDLPDPDNDAARYELVNPLMHTVPKCLDTLKIFQQMLNDF